MAQWDAYRNALTQSIYDEDVQEMERRRRLNQGTYLGRQALTEALAPVAPSAVGTGTSFGVGASSPMATSAPVFTAPTFAPAGVGVTSTTAEAGTGAATGLGMGAGAGIGLALAIASSTPDSPLFGAKKAMWKPGTEVNRTIDRVTDQNALTRTLFGPTAFMAKLPMKATNWIFGNPKEQEADYELRARKAGLANVLGLIGSASPATAKAKNSAPAPLWNPDE